MSKRPLKIDTAFLSDSDDDDDDLLKPDITSFLRKKSPPVVTPTHEECLTPLGTCTFALVHVDERFIGEELKLTLVDKGKVSVSLCQKVSARWNTFS